MKAILIGLCAYAAVSLASPSTLSPPQAVTFHLEVKGWPEKRRDEIRSQLNELVNSGRCFPLKEEADPKSAPHRPCHRFAWFEREDVLKPWKRSPTDIKMVFSPSKRMDQLIVQKFAWDGKRLRRILNSSYPLNKIESFKEEAISWSLKP